MDRTTADLATPHNLAEKVRAASPTVIVNAAGYTAVDRAEEEPEQAYRVNAEAVETLANSARASGACLIHYSTDYVFDGSKGEPYDETDLPNPLNIYGKSKLAGEQAIRTSGCAHFLFRTSWVFAARGDNFPGTILRLAREKEELQVVDDQIGIPTSARLIADVTRRVLVRIKDGVDRLDEVSGVYHLCSQGAASWYDYACFVVGQARELGYKMRVGPDGIRACRTAEHPRPAVRPSDVRLKTDKLESWLGMPMPPWETEVSRVVTEIVQEQTTL
jgi:dTDP-4-dehydrorhamnose reductase